MIYLDNPTARNIAQSVWGAGGTQSLRTNRRGAFYFTCSAHGGFVIDAAAFTVSERALIDQYATAESATAYVCDEKVQTYMHPYRKRSSRVSAGSTPIHTQFYLFEEDCAWCLPGKFAGIVTARHTQTQADDCFWRWYDSANPAVRNRQEVEQARAAQDPNLIVSASAVGTAVRVWCADGKSWIVDAYDQCRDAWGTPWLNQCQNVREHI